VHMALTQADLSNLVLDLMTYQAFVAGLTHIPEMMASDGCSLQESLLRVVLETCDSEFAFAGILVPGGQGVRVFASYPSPAPVELPAEIRSPVLQSVIESHRPDMVRNTAEDGREIAPGIRCALVVPYTNRGAQCVVCVCNRDTQSFARPGLGIPYVSHEVKMIQALVELLPI
jgi:hypothetical protein